MASKGTKQKPFNFTREDWPEDATTVKMSIDSEKGGVAFSDYLKVLTGTERPELFIIWKRDFDQKIAGNDKLQGDQKLDVLQRILSGEALSLVQRTLARTYYAEPNHKIHSTKRVQKKIQEIEKRDQASNILLSMGQEATETPTGASKEKAKEKSPNADKTDTATARSDKESETDNNNLESPIPKKKVASALTQYYQSQEYRKDVLEECMHALKLKIFGNDQNGKRSYIILRRFMRGMRVDLKHGIRAWANRMAELQSYLPECLWECGSDQMETPRSFTQGEMKEILDANMTHSQREKLEHISWDLYTHSFNTTIDKLENLEITIRKEALMHQRLTDLEKQTGVAKKTPKATSGGGHAKSPGKKKRPMDNSNKQLCKTCGKVHAGKCWKLTGGPHKKGKFDRETINLLKEHFVAKEQDSDAEQHSKPHWGRNLSNHEYSYVLATAQADHEVSNDEINISERELKEYRRKYRKTFKKKGSHN